MKSNKKEIISVIESKEGKLEKAAQLIIFGQDLNKCLHQNFQLLTNAGFNAIEAGDLFLEYGTVEQVKEVLYEHKIKLVAFHLGTSKVADIDKFNQICLVLKKLECSILICSGILYGGNTKTHYEYTGEMVNHLTRQAKQKGIALHYHHHDWELNNRFGDKLGLEVLMDKVANDTGFVIDTYWAKAGQTGLDFLWTKYSSRCHMIHLKDGFPMDKRFTPLGEGDASVEEAFKFFKNKNLKYLVWEQDKAENKNIRDCITTSSKWLAERKI